MCSRERTECHLKPTRRQSKPSPSPSPSPSSSSRTCLLNTPAPSLYALRSSIISSQPTHAHQVSGRAAVSPFVASQLQPSHRVSSLMLGDGTASLPPPQQRRRRSLSALTAARAPSPRLRLATSLSPRRRHTTMKPSTPTLQPPTNRTPDNVNEDELLCSICFDMLCFPVTLPCGHNFDRGCLLTAWEYDSAPPSTAAHPHAVHTDGHTQQHTCPLCRQHTANIRAEDLHVNLLLKKLITVQYPGQIKSLECDAKCCGAASTASIATGGTLSPRPAPSERSQRTWRTAASFFYVWLASITEPPGFVLAVLLLMSLLAIALTPQQMLTNPTTLPTLFDGMDHVLNGLVLLVREISFHLDQIDDLWPWMQVFSTIL